MIRRQKIIDVAADLEQELIQAAQRLIRREEPRTVPAIVRRAQRPDVGKRLSGGAMPTTTQRITTGVIRNPSLGGQKAWLKLGQEVGIPNIATPISIEAALTAYAGMDVSNYPSDNTMRQLSERTNLWWTGFYLAPAPGHGNKSWMKSRATLKRNSWGFAPLFVGPQLPQACPTCSHTLTSDQGRKDADRATQLANDAGFPGGTNIFLDIEPPTNSQTIEYYIAWVDRLCSQAQYYPGVYCPSKIAERLLLADSRPIFWVVDVGKHYCGPLRYDPNNPNVHVPSAGPFPIRHPAESEISFAKVWQYAVYTQGCSIELPRESPDKPAVKVIVDFDSAVSKDPSTIAQDPFNTLVQIFTAQIYTTGWTHFMPFVLKDKQYYLAYKANEPIGANQVTIDRVRPGVRPNPEDTRLPIKQVFRHSNWGKGWTAFVPFTIGGQMRYLAYDAATGRVSIDRIDSAGSDKVKVINVYDRVSYTKGWTHFMPFMLDGKSHYLAYKANEPFGANQVTIDRFRAAPHPQTDSPVDTVFSYPDWGKGWTTFMPFKGGGVQYYLAYNVATGRVSIDRIDSAGPDKIKVSNVYDQVSYTTGWTHFLPFVVGDHPHYLAYKEKTGQLTIDRILPGVQPDADGLPVETKFSTQWDTGWTSFMMFTFNKLPHILAYRKDNGYVTAAYYWVRFKNGKLELNP